MKPITVTTIKKKQKKSVVNAASKICHDHAICTAAQMMTKRNDRKKTK